MLKERIYTTKSEKLGQKLHLWGSPPNHQKPFVTHVIDQHDKLIPVKSIINCKRFSFFQIFKKGKQTLIRKIDFNNNYTGGGDKGDKSSVIYVS